MNVALSATGLAALGVAEDELGQFDEAFRAGMKARASEIGDVDANDPSQWQTPIGSTDIHALILLASDEEADLDEAVVRHVDLLVDHGLRLVFKQDGRARADLPGHEHFGFKDGISQPGDSRLHAAGCQRSEPRPARAGPAVAG